MRQVLGIAREARTNGEGQAQSSQSGIAPQFFRFQKDLLNEWLFSSSQIPVTFMVQSMAFST